MTLNEEFIQVLSAGIKEQPDDLLGLREYLVRFKDNGMNKENMLKNLEELRNISDLEEEDIVLDLMDFVVGYCNPELSVF